MELLVRVWDIKMNTIEKFMKLSAKLVSLVIIFGVLYSIHLVFSFVELYMDSQSTITLNSTIFFILALLLGLIFGLIFYSPFLYYGWIKNPNSSEMKTFTKFVTILYTGSIIFGVIFSGLKFPKIFMFLLVLIPIIPLYYYAWRKE